MADEQVIKALRGAKRVLTAAEPSDEAPSPRRFMDLAVFLKTLDVLAKLPNYSKIDPVGARLALASSDEFLGLAEQFLEPILDVRGFQSLRPKWKRLKQPKKTELQYRKRGAFVAEVYRLMGQKKAAVMRGMFNGPDLLAAKKLAAVGHAALGQPSEELQALADVHIMGGTTRTKKYVRDALSAAGIQVNEFDASMNAVAEARDLGSQIRAVETARNNTSADDPRHEDLAAESAQLQAKVSVLANESADPASVRGAAIDEASKAVSSAHATAMGKQLGLSAPQEDAMTVRGKSVIGAGAGSGKTRVLAGKVAHHIQELGVDPSQIIATSFSNKSAYELLERIRKYGGEEILPEDSLDGFGTTHSVSGKLLERFAGMGYGGKGDPKRAVLSGGQQTSLIKMAMKQVELRAAGAVPDMVSEGMFDQAMAQGQQAMLNPEQQETVPVESGPKPEVSWEEAIARVRDYHMANPHIRFADLRSGIAKTILRRNMGPKDISPKMRTAMRYAFEEVGIEYKASPTGGHVLLSSKTLPVVTPDPATVPVRAAIVSGAKSRFWKAPANQWFNLGNPKVWVEEGPGGRTRKISHKRVQIQIGKWKADLVSPSAAAEMGGGPYAAAYAAYEWLKANDPQAPAKRDHDDMLIQASQLLISNPSALAQMKAEKKFILVDEAQDLNKAQHLLFGLIAGYYDPFTQQPNEDGSMTADTYCFIGDDKQAIYEFRGADPNVFIELSTKHGFNTKLLEMNYRSGSAIVDAANNLIAKNDKQIPMVCQANPERGAGNINAVVVEDHEAAAAMTAQEIGELVEGEDNGFGADDFGIACRTNAEMHAFCLELSVRGVPYRCPKVQLFNDKTSKAIINWMSLPVAKSNTEINKIVLDAFRFPSFSLDKRFADHLQRAARGGNYLDYLVQGGWNEVYPADQAWRNARNVKPYADALQQMRNFQGSPAEALSAVLGIEGTFDPATGGAATIAESLVADARNDSEIMELLDEESGEKEITDEQVREAALAPVRPLMSLLERYEDLDLAMDYIHQLQEANKSTQKKGKPDKANKKDNAYDQPAVQIDTVHGWKGLEASHMYVPMAQGVFPHKLSQGEEEMASERRLAYVALTRGQNSVKVICPKVAHNGKDGGVSPFVDEGCIAVQGGEEPVPEVSDELQAKLMAEVAEELANLDAEEQALVARAFGNTILKALE